MEITDFMISTGELARFNFAIVDDNEKNISELKKMGCTDEEIVSMRSKEDNYLDVFRVLRDKGYVFSAKKGFYRE